MAVEPKIAIARILADLNLAVEPKITIARILVDLIWRFGTGSPYV